MFTSNLATVAQRDGTLLFVAWPAPDGMFAADSAEALEILTGLVGPTAVIALHYLTRRLAPPTISTTCDLGELSHVCGGGRNPTTRNGRIIRALARLEYFGYLRHDSEGRCELRTTIPPLHPARAARLAPEMRHLLAKYQPL